MSPKPRALIVEDDVYVAEVFARALEDEGFEAIVAGDGLEGLKRLTQEPFSVIVTDIKMPHLDGIELVRLAKASPLNKTTPIIVASGNLFQANAEKLAQLGMIDLLVKPFEMTALQQVVRRRLKTPAKVAYEAFVVQTLRDAASEVLSFYGGKDVAVGEPFIDRERAESPGVTGIVALFGRRLHGSLDVMCDAGFLKYLATQFFVNESADAMESAFHVQLVGELANQIAGKVKDRLQDLKFFVSLGVPAVVSGGVPQMVASPRVSVAVRCREGTGRVALALADLNESMPNAEESAKPLFVYSPNG